MAMARHAAHFDTLAASRDFEAAGMDRRQAEAIATQLATAVTAGHAELATRTELAKLETKMLTVAVGIVIAQTAPVFGLLNLVLRQQHPTAAPPNLQSKCKLCTLIGPPRHNPPPAAGRRPRKLEFRRSLSGKVELPAMIGYRYDDGGRAAAGFKGDVGDCVVRAIAILTGVPYVDVYCRMAAGMKQAGYSASGDGYRQKPRGGLTPRLPVRKIQNLVKTSYGLRRVNLGRGPRPTYTEAWLLHGDCLVGTAKHISAIVDNNLHDTFDNRVYDGRLHGGTASDERKAQSIWPLEHLHGKTVTTPEFDPVRLIPPPAS